jgi:hypothetical protein
MFFVQIKKASKVKVQLRGKSGKAKKVIGGERTHLISIAHRYLRYQKILAPKSKQTTTAQLLLVS